MWNRKELKANAKKRFQSNYWRAVLAALVITLAIGGYSGNFNYRFEDIGDKLGKQPAITMTNPIISIDNDDANEDAQVEINAANPENGPIIEINGDGSDGRANVRINGANGEPIIEVNGDGSDGRANVRINGANGEPIIKVKDDKVTINAMSEYEAAQIVDEVVDEVSRNGVWTGIAASVLIIIVVSILFALAVGICFRTFLLNPFEYGGKKFFVKNHYENALCGNLVAGFNDNYSNVVKTLFLRDLFTALWTALFVIPGVIKSYEYRMIPYLLSENPDMDYKEAFATSKKMMSGNKWAAFVLDLSFIGWSILNLLTFGLLGVFYVNPYIWQTDAELYLALKSKDVTEETPYENYIEVE